MKRFWCSIHKKIIHVHVLPTNVVNPLSDDPKQRVGTCRFHDSSESRDAVNVRVRAVHKNVKRTKTTPTPKKEKKGRVANDSRNP
jgi:hypothetical protein